MATSADYKVLIRQFSLVLSVILVLYLVLVRPLVQQGVKTLESEIRQTVTHLEKYIPSDEEGLLPTKGVLKSLEKSVAQEKRNYAKLKEFIDPEREYLPEEVTEAGLFFIEQLHITTKRLKRQASTLKIEIPTSFGFSEDMPESVEAVELLLKKLDLVDRLTTLLLEQNVREISLVKPLSLTEQRDEKTEKLFYRELPMQLSFLCSSSALVNVLYQMKNFSPVLIVKDIIVKKVGTRSLQVEMLLSRLIVT